jgi:hypothetical protein
MKASKIFISYTHDSEAHMNRVFELSERLRSDGVDSSIDQYEVSPPEGWPAWMRRQIKETDFVLVICSENYLKRYERSEELGKGIGAKWEGAIIGQELYEAEGRNTKFIPVVFTPDDVKYVPVEMRGGTRYVLDSDARYDDLYGQITDQPKTIKRKLGELRQLTSTVKQESTFSKPVKATQEAIPVVPSEPAKGHHSLVLLVQPGGTALFVRTQRIRVRGKLITLAIVPSDPRQTAAISALERTSEPIGIAYSLTALFVRVKSVEQIIEDEEVWHLELEEDEYATRGGLFEVSFSGYSNEQIAEMRARRILLDEKVDDPRYGTLDNLNKQFIESSLQGGYDSKFAIVRSPLPDLYSELNGNIDEFREAARLYSVLLLLLTHTVSQLLKIDLELRSEKELSVDFEGARPPRYSNEDPIIIRVRGKCSLEQ